MNIHKLRISCNLSLYQNWRTYKYSDRATAQAPLCDNNCKCNIFTSDTRISPPWLEDRSGDTAEATEGEEEEERPCGPEQCGLMCGAGEYCANTGRQGSLCEAVQCITFNV